MTNDQGNNLTITEDMWLPTNDSRDPLKEPLVLQEGINLNFPLDGLHEGLVTKTDEFGPRRRFERNLSPDFLQWMSNIDFTAGISLVKDGEGRITLFIDLNPNFVEDEEK